MKIKVILGSTRPNRVGERVAKWAAQKAGAVDGFEVELLDLRDYELPHFNEPASPRYNPKREPEAATQKWLDKLAEADGYVIVTPEYNHSIPGVLKNALDYVAFEMVKKPVAIVSYGTVGGARAAEHLKGIINEIKAVPVPEAVALHGPGEVLAEDGTFGGDTSSPWNADSLLGSVLEELNWWSKALAAGRAQK